MAVVLSSETAQLKVGATASTTLVSQVNSITIGAIEQEAIDTFSIGSTSRTQRPSQLPDFGKISIEIYFDSDNAEHVLLRTWASNATIFYYDFILSNGDKFSGQAFLTSFELNNIEVGKNTVASIEMKINSMTYTNTP